MIPKPFIFLAGTQQKDGSNPIMPRLQHVSTPIPAGTQQQVRSFYGGVLGLEEKEVPQTLKHLNLVWFAVGEGELELHFVPSKVLVAEEDPRHFCLVVEDLDACKKRVSEAGYPIIEDLAIHNRPRFFTRDPLGNRVELTVILGDYRDGQ
jgi:catechol 2,3-dioxygenase-like lactoylglutathione lyase family enzyme